MTESYGGAHPGVVGLLLATMMANIQVAPHAGFSTVLFACDNFHTSDPRDKIYATLGLIDDTEWPDDLLELVKPDYTLSVKEVYTRATIAAIRSSHWPFLSGLSGSNPRDRFRKPEAREEDFYEVPSWVPRYDLGPILGISPVKPSSRGCEGGTKCHFRLNPATEYLLRVKGIVLGEVTSINPSVPSVGDKVTYVLKTYGGLSKVMSCFETLFEATSGAKDASVTDHIKQTALTSTMFVKTSKDDGMLQAEDIVANFAAFVLMLKGSWIYPSDQMERCLFEAGAEHGDGVGHAKDICDKSYDRHFVTISPCEYGMAPLYTKPGDVVCIVFGCKVPFVLRPKGIEHLGITGEFWELIGDAYVYGAMEGEYIELLREERRLESESRWFSLI